MQSLVQGTVVVNATVDARGRISGVSVVSGPALLRDAVAASVKQWEFVPGPAGERQVSVEFRIPGLDAVTLEARSKQMEAQIKGPRPPRRPLAGRTVKNVMFLGVPEDARDEALSRLNIRVGDVLSNEGMDRGEGELRKYDSKIQFKVLSIGEADAEIILFRETARK